VYADLPGAATIAAAAKLTGKTASGWSVGLFDAVTAEEHARFVDPNGMPGTVPVEPRTSYGVWRIARDFGGGRSAVGVLATTTNRALPLSGELDLLPSSAYVLGVDGLHRFGGGRYQVAGSLFGSRVAGAPAAIDRIQRSAVQRIDREGATHLDYDPTATQLTGYSANVSFRKLGGGHWQFWLEGRAWSPGFEANDAGYLGRADQASSFARVGYSEFTPGRLFRSWRVNAVTWANYTFGGERLWTGIGVWGSAQLHNRWSFTGGTDWYLPRLDVDALRGGPAIRAEGRRY
jgi:hypothetical protein